MTRPGRSWGWGAVAAAEGEIAPRRPKAHRKPASADRARRRTDEAVEVLGNEAAPRRRISRGRLIRRPRRELQLGRGMQARQEMEQELCRRGLGAGPERGNIMGLALGPVDNQHVSRDLAEMSRMAGED